MIYELAEPSPMSEMARGELLDRVYESLSGPEHDRHERIAWALQAGGEVR